MKEKKDSTNIHIYSLNTLDYLFPNYVNLYVCMYVCMYVGL